MQQASACLYPILPEPLSLAWPPFGGEREWCREVAHPSGELERPAYKRLIRRLWLHIEQVNGFVFEVSVKVFRVIRIVVVPGQGLAVGEE